MRTVLPLLLVLVVVGAAVWLLLLRPGMEAEGEAGSGLPFPLPAEERPPAGEGGETPPPLPLPPPPPPVRDLPRIGILEGDGPVPSSSPDEAREAERRAEALRLPVRSTELSGTDLLEAASGAYYVRTREQRDLVALERLRFGDDDLHGREELRFGDLLDLWMQAGFHVRPEGAFLVFEDVRREERYDEPPPPPEAGEEELPPR